MTAAWGGKVVSSLRYFLCNDEDAVFGEDMLENKLIPNVYITTHYQGKPKRWLQKNEKTKC